MPKIEVEAGSFFSLCQKEYYRAELEKILTNAKAEIDEWPNDEAYLPKDKDIIKIELNDTNRPDLWSTVGLARAVKYYTGSEIKSYDIFTEKKSKPKLKVIVDEKLREVRPYLAGFVASGKKITDSILRDLIQTQEKICWNFGRKRKAVSMGIYRSAKIQWPVRYIAADPKSVKFIPLGFDKSLSLEEIIMEHPKGREFGHINKAFKLHPLLTDSKGSVLSYPPVINSADLGSVEIGDDQIFIELTGSDQNTVSLTSSIIACDLIDLGFNIETLEVEYPWQTEYGKNIIYPFYFQEKIDSKYSEVDLEKISKLLGEEVTKSEVIRALEKMGVKSHIDGSKVKIKIPEYRNDFLHPVDIIEDVLIGIGLDNFKAIQPRAFTIGRLSSTEIYSRRVKDLMIGLGYQEMAFNYLGSKKDFVDKMGGDDSNLIRIKNPMSESFECLRFSILPSLLEAEFVSSKAIYPHKIFELGKVVLADNTKNYGAITKQCLGSLLAHAESNFNEIASHLATLLYFLSKEYAIIESNDERFINGRQANIIFGKKAVGIFGEISPSVLEAWNICMPCSAIEIFLSDIFPKDEAFLTSNQRD